MKLIFLLFLPIYLYCETSFITPLEYSAQLYENPRGIGCQHCHGADGEGKLIANYIHKNKKKSFRGPVINDISYRNFYIALNKRKKGMPRYFLTDKEIEALYLHLHQDGETKKKNAK